MGPIQGGGRKLGFYPEHDEFSLQGHSVTKLGGDDENNRVAKYIAELGLNVWEVVAAGTCRSGGSRGSNGHILYFKRPVTAG